VRALAVDSAARTDREGDDLESDPRGAPSPMGALGQVRRAFWRRSQAALVAPYADRYLQALPTLHLTGMIRV
jgi:aminopeptidase N